MTRRARLRGFWDSVRPRTRRGGLLAALAIAAGALALSGVFYVGAASVTSPYLEPLLHPDSNARSWAALETSYGQPGLCASCHLPEYRKETTAKHATIGCESCHGPLLAHAQASPGAAAAAVRIAVPKDDVCIACHVRTQGRPDTVRQIVPAGHYVANCLDCHDPHTGVSQRPPVVVHPLDNLPPCIVCHGPDGFKARTQRHPTVRSEDSVCLSCHAAGRGPQAAPRPG